jgi:SNF2 family DNA or RNA helicase
MGKVYPKAPRNVKSAILGFDRASTLARNITKASAIVNWAELTSILNGSVKPTKRHTFLVAAFLIAAGLIRFKNTKKDIGVGIDGKQASHLGKTGVLAMYRDIRDRQEPIFFPCAHENNDSFMEFLLTLRMQLDSTDIVAQIEKKNTFGLEAVGDIQFKTPAEGIVFWLSSLIEKLNAGHFGISSIIEAIEKHVTNRKHIDLSIIDKFIKSLEHIVSPDQQQQMLDARNKLSAPIEVPDLNPHKRPYEYQWSGINWMLEAERGILAFDTGLGKTMCAIAAVYAAKQLGLADGGIIFTKNAIITDFAKEIKSVWPSARVSILHGTKMHRLQMMEVAKNSDFIISSYGPLIRNMEDELELFRERNNAIVFFDEGGRMRNASTQMRQSAEYILADRKYAFILDATPYPNDVVVESFNLIDFLRENQLGTIRAWKRRFSARDDKDIGGRVQASYSNLEAMRAATAPFIYVKREDDPDVDAQLPPDRIDIDKMFTMGPKQAAFYQAAEDFTLQQIVNMLDPRNASFKNPTNVLAGLVKQRQAAISPWLIDKSYCYDEERLELVIDLVEQWLNSKWKSSIVIGTEFVSIYPRFRELLMKRIDKLTPEMVVLFSGETNLTKGNAIKDGINDGTIKVAMLGFGSAGAGINLQHNAHRVIVLHKPWNPNKVKQFIARVDRQGQQERVKVVNLIAEDTIDERIEKLLERKAFEQEQMLVSDSTKKGRMSIGELAELAGFSLGDLKRKANEKQQVIDIDDDTTFASV